MVFRWYDISIGYTPNAIFRIQFASPHSSIAFHTLSVVKPMNDPKARFTEIAMHSDKSFSHVLLESGFETRCVAAGSRGGRA
jgi:hypothetical protein